MAVDDATIQAWLQQNAGASDADIRSAMDQYGVDTSQMVRATGMDYETMQSRYDGAAPVDNTNPYTQPTYTQPTQPTQPAQPNQPDGVSDATIQAWLQQNANASDAGIRAAMDQYGVDASQMARATGMNITDVQGRYDRAGGGLLGQANTAAPKDTYTDDQVRSWVSQYIDVKNPKGLFQPELTRLAKDMQQYGVGFEQMGRILGLQAFGGQNNDSVENLYAVGFNGGYNRNAGHGLGQGGAARDAKLTSEFNAVKGDPSKTRKWMTDNNVSLDDVMRISGTGMTMSQLANWTEGTVGGMGNAHLTPEAIAQYKANGYSDEAIRQKGYWVGGFDDYDAKITKLLNGVPDPNSKFATGGSAPRGTTPNTGGVTPLPGTGGGDPVPNPAGPNWTVDDPQTVEGRLNNLLKTDDGGTYTNPVIRQAVDRALQAFNGRGLLNSSMAQQAAQEAAISKATEIAKSDAETYAAAAKQNAQNAWQGGENTVAFERDLAKLQAQHDYKTGDDSIAFDRDLARLAAQHGYTLEEVKLRYGLDTSTQEANRDEALRASYRSQVSQANVNYTTTTANINNSNMTAEQKAAAMQIAAEARDSELTGINEIFAQSPRWRNEWSAVAVRVDAAGVASINSESRLLSIIADPAQKADVKDAARLRLTQLRTAPPPAPAPAPAPAPGGNNY